MYNYEVFSTKKRSLLLDKLDSLPQCTDIKWKDQKIEPSSLHIKFIIMWLKHNYNYTYLYGIYYYILLIHLFKAIFVYMHIGISYNVRSIIMIYNSWCLYFIAFTPKNAVNLLEECEFPINSKWENLARNMGISFDERHWLRKQATTTEG